MNLTAKRFGVKRLILNDMGYTDSFSIPAGHRVRYVAAKTIAEMTTGGALSLGSANSGIESASFSVTNVAADLKETASFTVTDAPTSNGAITVDGNSINVYGVAVAEVVTLSITAGCSTSGNVGIVLPSLAQVDIAVLDTDDAAAVAGKIRSGTFTGWTASGADTTVLFTKDVAGAVAGAAQMFVGSTGVDGSILSTTAGQDVDTVNSVATKIAAVSYTDWDCDSTDALVEFEGKLPGPLTDIVFTDTGTTGTTISSIIKTDGVAAATAGDITVAGETVAITLGTPTTASVATQIAAHSFTDWTVSRLNSTLTFTAKGEGARDNVTVALDTATGITFSAVTTTGGTAHAEIAAATTLTNSAGAITDVPVVAAGCFAPATEAKTAYINLGHGDLVNNVELYVGLEKYI